MNSTSAVLLVTSSTSAVGMSGAGPRAAAGKNEVASASDAAPTTRSALSPTAHLLRRNEVFLHYRAGTDCQETVIQTMHKRHRWGVDGLGTGRHADHHFGPRR